MGLLLRKITPNKWTGNLKKHRSNFSADSITGCTRTSQNTLSVWSSKTPDFKSDEVKELIVGLALSMPQPAKIDVIWLDEAKLQQKGLEVESTMADSVFTHINQRHKDISNLDHDKLGLVAEHIVEQFSESANRHSIKKPDLIALVTEWLGKEDTFELEDLNDKWLEAVQKKQAAQ